MCTLFGVMPDNIFATNGFKLHSFILYYIGLNLSNPNALHECTRRKTKTEKETPRCKEKIQCTRPLNYGKTKKLNPPDVK